MKRQSESVVMISGNKRPLTATERMQRKHHEARRTQDEANGLITPDGIAARIRVLLDKGKTLSRNKKRKSAISLFRDAYRLSLRYNQDYDAVDAAHMLGVIEKPEQQLKWNRKALSLAMSSKNRKTRKWLGCLYNNIGWTYYDLKKYENALDAFRSSLSYRKKQKDVTLNVRWAIGRVYRALNRIGDGLRIQSALLLEMKRRKLEPDGYVYEELAECLLANDRLRESRKYFKKAYQLLSQNDRLRTKEPPRLKRLKELSGAGNTG